MQKIQDSVWGVAKVGVSGTHDSDTFIRQSSGLKLQLMCSFDYKTSLARLAILSLILLLTCCSGSRQRYYFSKYTHSSKLDSIPVRTDSTSGRASLITRDDYDTTHLSPRMDTTFAGDRGIQDSLTTKSIKSQEEINSAVRNHNQKKREQSQSQKKKQKPGEDGRGMAVLALFLGLVFMQSGSLIVLGGALLTYLAGFVLAIRGIKKGHKSAKLSLFILLLIGFAALILLYEIMTMSSFGADPFAGII
ncbi:MAG: hypothetical protein JNK18_03520 [Cyclobacteriaceae bacterium]|nr:hypothetical protein [Cyclobacteriaceae bacterium]